jgi:hypothetical protein
MRFLRLTAIACILFIYSSCKKDSSSLDLTPSFYFLNGDTTASSFNNNLILFSSSDTIMFNAIISSTYLLPENATVTVAADDNAITSYNTNHGTTYVAMPSNAYSFPTSVTTITGSIYDTIPVIIYKHALDVTKNYMLAINITGTGGHEITEGASEIYLHTVNSELAGIYNSTGRKIMYNGDAADSSINSVDSFALTKSLIPSNSITSQIDYADLGSNGWKYNLSFSVNGFLVTPNEVIQHSVQSGSFEVIASSYDPATKNIYIKSRYKNSSGNERIIEENLALK